MICHDIVEQWNSQSFLGQQAIDVQQKSEIVSWDPVIQPVFHSDDELAEAQEKRQHMRWTPISIATNGSILNSEWIVTIMQSYNCILHIRTTIGLLSRSFWLASSNLDDLDRLWMNTLVGGTNQGAPDRCDRVWWPSWMTKSDPEDWPYGWVPNPQVRSIS